MSDVRGEVPDDAEQEWSEDNEIDPWTSEPAGNSSSEREKGSQSPRVGVEVRKGELEKGI